MEALTEGVSLDKMPQPSSANAGKGGHAPPRVWVSTRIWRRLKVVGEGDGGEM